MPDIAPDDETVTTSGVARILGVSRQRADQLSRQTGFPAPTFTDDLGRRWSRSAVEEYARQRKEATQ